MKDFTYIVKDEYDLHISDCNWLVNMGLVETQWFLDIKWLMGHTTYHKWIDS